MHTIEPYFRWRDYYTAETDDRSPFYMRTYDEFGFTNAIYDHYIHPQWDDFGSLTLYMKILWIDYAKRFAIIEFIGEWNDVLYNDIMNLKRNIIDHLNKEGIIKYILIGDNVLNFHADDDSYYQEWYEDIIDENGWIVCLNLLEHVKEEMIEYNLNYYFKIDEKLNNLDWRIMKPDYLFNLIDKYMEIKSIE